MFAEYLSAEYPQLGTWVAALLTLFILSYAVRDNPLSRLAQHLLAGTVAGYAVVVALRQILGPQLFLPLVAGLGLWPAAPAATFTPIPFPLLPLPLALCLCLLVRPLPRLRWLSAFPLALLMGAGAMLAMMGAISGTLVPLSRSLIVSLAFHPAGATVAAWGQFLSAFLLTCGSLAALASFTFAGPSSKPLGRLWYRLVHTVSLVGRVFVLLALGGVFGAVVVSRLTILIARLSFLLNDWGALFR
ncbi:MAG: hypothetical protein EXR62_03870 [Chloroflexi bacterium]|nr:hypothetical protein [Chloroflexota bacterium]